MLKKYVCENSECPQGSIEITLFDPAPITTCGGCGTILEGVGVNE